MSAQEELEKFQRGFNKDGKTGKEKAEEKAAGEKKGGTFWNSIKKELENLSNSFSLEPREENKEKFKNDKK